MARAQDAEDAVALALRLREGPLAVAHLEEGLVPREARLHLDEDGLLAVHTHVVRQPALAVLVDPDLGTRGR